jgi:hypothetical protein
VPGHGTCSRRRVLHRPIALATATSILALAGCSWSHAPGHDAQQGMTRTALPAIKPQLCREGACDLAGPGGTIHVSNVEVSRLNDRRGETAFQMEYLATKATCRGPAIGPDDQEVPFACSFDGPPATASRYVLVMDTGCMRGTLREIARTGETRRLDVATDQVTVAGFHAPGREVSLSDGRGVLAYSDAPTPFDRVLYTRPSSAPTPSEILAITALHTFADLEGHPPQCLTPP